MRDRVRFASFLLGGIRYEETIKIFALGIWSRLGLSDHCGDPLSQRKQHELFRIAGSVYVCTTVRGCSIGIGNTKHWLEAPYKGKPPLDSCCMVCSGSLGSGWCRTVLPACPQCLRLNFCIHPHFVRSCEPVTAGKCRAFRPTVCNHQYSICNYIRSICEYAVCSWRRSRLERNIVPDTERTFRHYKRKVTWRRYLGRLALANHAAYRV